MTQQFTYIEEATTNNVQEFEMFERTQKLHDHMQQAADWHRDAYNTMMDYLGEFWGNYIIKQLSPEDSLRTRRRRRRQLTDSDYISKPGDGCDNMDNDEINGVDNCEEDLTPPEVLISKSATSKKDVCDAADYCFDEFFSDSDDAVSFLNYVFFAIDDCAFEDYTHMDVQLLSGDCAETIYELTPRQTFPSNTDCSDVELTGDKITAAFGVDEITPDVLCSFHPIYPDPDHNHNQRNLAQGLISDDGKMMLIEPDAQVDLLRLPFSYNIIENCPGNVEVEVSIKTNEAVVDEKPIALVQPVDAHLYRNKRLDVYINPRR